MEKDMLKTFFPHSTKECFGVVPERRFKKSVKSDIAKSQLMWYSFVACRGVRKTMTSS